MYRRLSVDSRHVILSRLSIACLCCKFLKHCQLLPHFEASEKMLCRCCSVFQASKLVPEEVADNVFKVAYLFTDRLRNSRIAIQVLDMVTHGRQSSPLPYFENISHS